MDEKTKEYCRQVLAEIRKGKIKGREGLEKLKLQAGKRLGIGRLPSNPDILMQAGKISPQAAKLLSIKPLRTLSGVAPVAIMARPQGCPHGKCIYCPGGPNSAFGDVPQSYTGHEPATMRGIANNFDPYLQAMNRISQFYATGHCPQKLELIIMGGTFPAMPQQYQEEFVAGAFAAANDFSQKFFRKEEFMQEKFGKYFSAENGPFMPKKELQKRETGTVEKEHERNEKAKVRIVTLCIETKPDWSLEPHINGMLRLGATRVELGVQSLSDKVLGFANRGHTLKDTVEATRLLRDSGLKVTSHMMPGLPMSTKDSDIDMFRELFENPDYRPDALKIYPCMVMPGTALEKMYRAGKFSPQGTQEAAQIIAQAKRFFPEYMRVHRIQRDIPAKFSAGGIDKNNLRQIVEAECKKRGIRCRCIRCRESGISTLAGIETDYSKVGLVEREYEASMGREVFISYEDLKNDTILGFCRLRMPYKPFRREFCANTACIRELHVFGPQLGIGEQSGKGEQHRGFGIRLVERAEEIAAGKFDAKKMLVISGVGAREYYRKKLRYERDGIYMGKKIGL
ncbi:MAG TPA: tRNA uridine(34) 5-carboxymethylaminomethyl modification radical SAM/GNAT enzyme Elp3 [Candidatus Diapherotrites archaeon]|uniref:tRNA carboxymethyluridine synthase n=1 Tax=Candidatus Iainarchaeum sp. TaxID=3101447 RepID=A0A7J4IYE6_9ARCH|nr:tRNA uridine(34) 5-carboxymethylaminomethyl modification radical SAM/GNAT enzyme Elp3 [Candidatus Diapherotrites archaeon]